MKQLKRCKYEEKIQSDPNTMSYNAGWNINYAGYHYDTGCIDFPKEKWEETFNKRKADNRFFGYLKDNQTNEFVGYVNYQLNKNSNKYECGIVIEHAKRNNGYGKEGLILLCQHAKQHGAQALYDNFEHDRKDSKVFFDVGFKVEDTYIDKRFDREIEIHVVKIEL